MIGVVVDFDEAAGLGRIVSGDGVSYPFHCIEIADGTRRIEPDTPVVFEPLGRFGAWQAADIRQR